MCQVHMFSFIDIHFQSNLFNGVQDNFLVTLYGTHFVSEVIDIICIYL
jgi:hypothetical protein